MPATKHTQDAPSTKMECDYLNGWIKKQPHTQKSHPKWWTSETHLGTQKKKKACWWYWTLWKTGMPDFDRTDVGPKRIQYTAAWVHSVQCMVHLTMAGHLPIWDFCMSATALGVLLSAGLRTEWVWNYSIAYVSMVCGKKPCVYVSGLSAEWMRDNCVCMCVCVCLASGQY